MLTIGCIGWGSLIWDPRDLPVRSPWFNDGPHLPIEFARQANNGRITLVICDVNYRVRTYWALLEASDLGGARRALAAREGVRAEDTVTSTGFWEAASGTRNGAGANDVAQWAQTKGLDAVVWANLEIGLKSNRGVVPSIDEVIACLHGLTCAERRLAEEYIRKAPAQTDTEYRRRIAQEFSWLPHV